MAAPTEPAGTGPGPEERAAEVATKLTSVRGWLHAAGRAGAVFGSQAGFAWITAGGDSHISLGEASGAGFVVVTPGEACVLSTNIERRRLFEEEVGGLGFRSLDWPWYEPDRAHAELAKLCDPAATVSDTVGLGAGDAGGELAALRLTLAPSEIARYRALGRDAAIAVDAACSLAHPGSTELEVAAAVAAESERRGILPLVNLVAADERIARYRHPIPTRRTVRRTLLVALTGRRHGLHASLTRMMSFGPPDGELARRHAAVLRVDAHYLVGSRAGRSLGEIVDGAVSRYADEGFSGEWKLHHQGGLTGYAGREIFGAPGVGHRLRANQAVAWNPSITSVKSEDTALVTEDGIDVLTTSGAWPQVEVRVEGEAVQRPALLEAPP